MQKGNEDVHSAQQGRQKRRRQHQVGKAVDYDEEFDQPPAAEQGIVPKIPFRWILSGASGSGKSNAARYIMDHYYSKSNGSWFDRVIFLSPTAKIDPVWKNLAGLSKQDRMEQVDPEKLTRILRKAEKETKAKGKKKTTRILLILDDVIAESKFMHSKEFLKLFIRGRHFMISTMCMTQSYVKIPRSSRIQATHIIFFPSQTTEIERLYSEYGPHQMSKRAFFAMVQEATDPSPEEPYPFLYIDRYAPIDTRFRRNLDIALNVDQFQAQFGGRQRKKRKNNKKGEDQEVDPLAQDAVREEEEDEQKFSMATMRTRA